MHTSIQVYFMHAVGSFYFISLKMFRNEKIPVDHYVFHAEGNIACISLKNF